MAKKPHKLDPTEIEDMTLEQAIQWLEGFTPQAPLPADLPWKLIRVLRHVMAEQKRDVAAIRDGLDALTARIDEAFEILLPEDEGTG